MGHMADDARPYCAWWRHVLDYLHSYSTVEVNLHMHLMFTFLQYCLSKVNSFYYCCYKCLCITILQAISGTFSLCSTEPEIHKTEAWYMILWNKVSHKLMKLVVTLLLIYVCKPQPIYQYNYKEKGIHTPKLLYIFWNLKGFVKGFQITLLCKHSE